MGDRNTTLSRSFRSSLFQSQSSPLQLIDGDIQVVNKYCNKMTLNERFAALTEDDLEDKDKMSQVRVLTSPPPSSANNLVSTSASRTPATAREKSSKKKLLSNMSRKSLKSMFTKKDDKRHEDVPATTETNVETTEDEDVFVSHVREESAGQMASRGQVVRRESYWTDPKKQRKVGSPGRTGNADYFLKQAQAPLRSVDIDIGAGDDGGVRTEFVPRTKIITKKSVSSAPQPQVQSRMMNGGAKPKDSNKFLKPPSLRKKSNRRSYKPGYSESEDITDFTSDEERRQVDRRMRLELPPRGPSPTSSCGDLTVTPPPPASTDVSPDPSPLLQYSLMVSPDPRPLVQYSSVSFTQSEMDLVGAGSPSTIKSPEVVASEAAVEADAGIQSTSEDVLETGQSNSEAASLQWDDYDHESELSFKKIN